MMYTRLSENETYYCNECEIYFKSEDACDQKWKCNKCSSPLLISSDKQHYYNRIQVSNLTVGMIVRHNGTHRKILGISTDKDSSKLKLALSEYRALAFSKDEYLNILF